MVILIDNPFKQQAIKRFIVNIFGSLACFQAFNLYHFMNDNLIIELYISLTNAKFKFNLFVEE